MTAEERLDRLERIARLMVRSGLRARREMRHQDDKITIMIDAQIKNEDRFAELAQFQKKTDRRFAETDRRFAELVESQKNTDRRLAELIDIVREGRNGKSR